MCRGNKVSGVVVVVVVVVDFELIRIYFTDTFQWPSTSRLSGYTGDREFCFKTEVAAVRE